MRISGRTRGKPEPRLGLAADRLLGGLGIERDDALRWKRDNLRFDGELHQTDLTQTVLDGLRAATPRAVIQRPQGDPPGSLSEGPDASTSLQ